LGNLSQLDGLYLDNNQLSGEIPTSLSNLTNLSSLYLDHNNLTASDQALINFLNELNPSWTEVQVTVAGGSEKRSGSSGTKPLRFTMTVFVEIYGKGQGRVVSEPAGIDCEPTHCQAVDYAKDPTGMACDSNYCSSVVDTATTVTLTAIPDSGSIFKGWGGHKDCGDGELFMIGNKLCIACFGQLED
jgi:hypothetical protein